MTHPELVETINAILSAPTYIQFERWIGAHSDIHLKGRLQEIFAKIYFLSHRKHYKIEHYYSRLLDSIPINLGVHEKDVGSDGIIVHTNNKISLVQVKYRTNQSHSMLREYVSGMSLEALALKDRFEKLYLFSNTYSEPKMLNSQEREYTKCVLAETLQSCHWELVQTYAQNMLSGKDEAAVTIKEMKLRTWQKEAVDFVLSKGAQFGICSVIAACGSGKTWFSKHIIQNPAYKKILVLVPNLHLLSQWFECLATWLPNYEYCLVGSDLDHEGVSEEIPFTLTTQSSEIEKYIDKDSWVCISTYQSLNKIIEVANVSFDLCICDEAHRCCGRENKKGELSFSKSNFTLPVRNDFPAINKLYITATPKVFTGSNKEVVFSMDQEAYFGPQYTYSFARAIEDKVICDYKICVGHGIGTYDEAVFDAQFLFNSVHKYKINSVLVFSSSHQKSKLLYLESKKLFDQSNNEGKLSNEDSQYELILMLSGANGRQKAKVVSKLASGKKLIIFNVRVFSIGSDMPALESVMLRGGNKSIIDTVQSVSRCLRKCDGKDYAKILIPCLVETNDLDGKGNFSSLRTFISSMGSVDESLVQEIVLSYGKKVEGKIKVESVFKKEELEVGDELKKFEVAMYDRIMKGGIFSGKYRFELLKEFCVEKGRLPPRNEDHKGIKIGIFLGNLLGGKQYQNDRDRWIKQLLAIESINKELKERIENRNDEEKQKSRSFSPTQRFEALKEYCLYEGKLPPYNEIYKVVKIGSFLNSLLGEKRYQNDRDQWIKQLLAIKSINKELKERIENRTDQEKQKSRSFSSNERLEALKDFCANEGKLPHLNEDHKGIKIGNFLSGLLGGKQNKNDRDQWIKQLLAIESINKELKERIENINDPEKQKSRAFSPKQRLEALKEFCVKNRKLPPYNEIYKGIKICIFLNGLLGGKQYQNDRDQWMEQLLAIESINKELKERIENRTDQEKKKSRSFSSNERFEALKEYCLKEGKLPYSKEIHSGIKIGSFLGNLLGEKKYQNDRDQWMEQLLAIESINKELKERIKNINNQEKKKSRSFSSKERFEALKEYCLKEGKLPPRNEDHKGIKIGNFLKDLLGGKYYQNDRDQWVERLLAIESINKELKGRIENITDQGK